MNKIEFFRIARKDGELGAVIETGMPMVIFNMDKSKRLILVNWRPFKEWWCTEIYTGLLLTSGKTKAELFERIPNQAGYIFESVNHSYDHYWDRMHQIVADAYRQLDETRPSGLFGRHSLSQELIEYITAPTFKEAISNGKEE